MILDRREQGLISVLPSGSLLQQHQQSTTAAAASEAPFFSTLTFATIVICFLRCFILGSRNFVGVFPNYFSSSLQSGVGFEKDISICSPDPTFPDTEFREDALHS